MSNEAYVTAGKRCIRLRGKVPIERKWEQAAFSDEIIDGNFGWALDRSDLIIDVDPRNGGNESLDSLCDRIGINLLDECRLAVRTGGGGLHLCFTKDSNIPIHRTLSDYPGIDFKSFGGQVVGVGSIHPDTGRTYEWLEGKSDFSKVSAAPKALIALLRRAPAAPGIATIVSDNAAAVQRFRETLASTPPAVEGQHGDERTFRVAALGKDYGLSDETTHRLMLEDWNDRCQPPWDSEELWAKVRNAYRYSENKSGVLTAEAEFDVVPVEDAVEEAKKSRAELLDSLADQWTYSLGIKRFVDVGRGIQYDKEQFNDAYPALRHKTAYAASIAINSPRFPKVDLPAYEPGKDRTFTEAGVSYVNTWADTMLTPVKGETAPFHEHLRWLFPAEVDRNLLLDYFAFMVQVPGEKVTWAPVIQGAEGCGKSFLGLAMERIIGRRNTSRPSNEEVHAQYTGWLESCQLVIIEELMASEKLDLMNILKPLITDPYVRVKKRYVNEYSISNHFNFLMFTNFKEALFIGDNDRRYAFFFADVQDWHQIEERMAATNGGYFQDLFSWLYAGGDSAIAYELWNRDISKFDPKARAPRTRHREEALMLSEPEVDSSIRLAVVDGVISGDLVSLSTIAVQLEQEGIAVSGSTSKTISKALQRLGFRPVGRIRFRGSRHSLWSVKNHKAYEGKSSAELAELFKEQVEFEEMLS